MVCGAMDRRQTSRGCLVDVGCGAGNLHRHIRSRFFQYIGVDAVRYEDFSEQADFCRFELDSERIPLPDASVDA